MGERSHDAVFMSQIKDWFLSRQSNQFLITGNVLDIVPWTPATEEAGDSGALLLSEYLTARLSLKRRLVITFNIAHGITFSDDEARLAAKRIYASSFPGGEKDAGDRFDEIVTRSVAYSYPALLLLRTLCAVSSELPEPDGISIGVIIEQAESLLPDLPVGRMTDSDRQRVVFFREWLTERSFSSSDHILLLISETTSAISESIRSLPHLINIHIPLPDADTRRRFIRQCVHSNPGLKLVGSQREFAQLTAGMPLISIEQTMRLAAYQGRSVTQTDFSEGLERLLLSRIGDHITIAKPRHGLRDVIGNAELKKQLKRLSAILHGGDSSIAPVGILLTGPNGVGKTFIATAWAAESGYTVLVLRNLRSSFFGGTDQIFEKIRQVLEVLGNVMILIDEADTVLRGAGGHVHETEQRLFGNIIQMMGDPKNRGRIVWVLMTARPDNLAPDIKRSGRCGLHFPVFDPEGSDLDVFIDETFNLAGFPLKDLPEAIQHRIRQSMAGRSPAEFHELAAELRAERQILKRLLTADDVLRIIDDMVVSGHGVERRLQALQASLHCSRKSLIPPSFASLDPEEVQREIAILQRQVT